MSDNYVFYGARLNSQQLWGTLDHIFQAGLAQEEKHGHRPTPVCIWGTHGLGKTMVVQEYAQKHGWKLAYCAPAQFEEMGDLHGMPMTIDPDPDVVGDEYTVVAPPDWVPKEEGPGILMLDDVNRADDRILRGLMQLLQNFEMFSWALPNKWLIVATANPEGGDYSVTPMDDAMLTRMLHMTMVFDVKAWAAWATTAGIDPRGISFVLTYPEIVTGKRTTPRSLSQLFEMIAPIPDLKASIDLVRVLAMSTLDEPAVLSFMSFINDGLEQLMAPEEILDAPDTAAMLKRLTSLAKGSGGDSKRVDRLATICTRLMLELSRPDYLPGERHSENFAAFFLCEALPRDLRHEMHKQLSNLPNEEAKKALIRHPKVALAILEAM